VSDMTRSTRQAVVVLLILALLLAAANLFWTSHVVRANQAAQQKAAQITQAAQRRAGQIVEQKLCATLSQLASLQPPSGSAGANPSRAYEQQLHVTLSQLGTDLGCPTPEGR
jgi:type II secretory pathway pseudopilin PulG